MFHLTKTFRIKDYMKPGIQGPRNWRSGRCIFRGLYMFDRRVQQRVARRRNNKPFGTLALSVRNRCVSFLATQSSRSQLAFPTTNKLYSQTNFSSYKKALSPMNCHLRTSSPFSTFHHHCSERFISRPTCFIQDGYQNQISHSFRHPC